VPSANLLQFVALADDLGVHGVWSQIDLAWTRHRPVVYKDLREELLIPKGGEDASQFLRSELHVSRHSVLKPDKKAVVGFGFDFDNAPLHKVWAPFHSIVVSCLQKVDRFLGDPIHKAVFLSNASGPTAAEHMLQWLWLSGALERASNDSVNKLQDFQGYRSLVLDPEAKILKKLSLKYCDPLRLAFHQVSLLSRASLSGA
jgi:hypothetical protein